MSAHVTNEELIDYAAGDITGPRLDIIEQHVLNDASAGRMVEDFRLVARIAAIPPFPSLDAGLLRRLRGIPSKLQKTGPHWLERLDAAVAWLVFDSRAQPALTRADGDTDLSLTLDAPEATIDVRVTRDADTPDGGWILTGQVDRFDGRDVDGAIVVHSRDDGEVLAVVDIDGTGYFRTSISQPDVEVLFRSGDTWVHLDELEFE